MSLAEHLERSILPRVERPGRYLGCEVNAVTDPDGEVHLHLALAFPDLYDLALGNLGLHLLYEILNDLDHVWAERVYAPARDLAALLRQEDLPLFTLESRCPLHRLDALGFSLQSELTFTNVLEMLHLGGIPVRARDRGEEAPLVFAGGPAASNPEPMAPFLDFVVIGDGEAVIREIAEVLLAAGTASRGERIERVGRLDGVYVPGEGPPASVQRRIERRLGERAAGTRPVVPFTSQVHERLGIEVLRGCTRGCRFCQAGFTGRPVREREVAAVGGALEKGLRNTGFQEAALLSLSTCDHSRIHRLVPEAAARALPHRASVGLPSIRLESVDLHLVEHLSDIRRAGLTFAPEAATTRLRRVIDKPVTDEALLALCSDAYDRGWDTVKLYFMIGLPTETEDDVRAIGRLAVQIWQAGRAVNRRARLNLGVSTFVPKPHTPLQWASQISIEEVERRHGWILDEIRKYPRIRFGRHDPVESWLEGLLCRGGREMAPVVEDAWRRGACFDGWREFRDPTPWRRAIESAGVDEEPLFRERDPSIPLPWDFVSTGVSRAWLVSEWEAARRGAVTPDCRQDGCGRCGLMEREPELCREMLQRSAEGRRERGDVRIPPASRPSEPPVAQRMALVVVREGSLRFLSHRETADTWIRACRRASLPLSYSQGYHAHPRVAFSSALAVEMESVAEFVDLRLTRSLEPAELAAVLAPELPRGLRLRAVLDLPLDLPSLMSMATGAEYRIWLPGDLPPIRRRVEALLSRSEIRVRRGGGSRRKRPRERDIRPLIRTLEATAVPEGGGPWPDSTGLTGGTLLRLVTGSPRGAQARPRDVLGELLEPVPVHHRVHKVRVIGFHEESPFDLGVRLVERAERTWIAPEEASARAGSSPPSAPGSGNGIALEMSTGEMRYGDRFPLSSPEDRRS